jgi:hypothetical protein
MPFKRLVLPVLALFLCTGSSLAQKAKPSELTTTNQADKNPVITNESLPSGARIYIAPMPSGFESYVAAGLEKKKVPVVLVTDRDKADYELTVSPTATKLVGQRCSSSVPSKPTKPPASRL